MRYFILIVLTLFFVFKANSTKTHIAIKQTGLQLNTFTKADIPPINGCGTYFYLTMDDKKAGKYIGINDLVKVAFIKIGNKLETFSQVKSTNLYSKPLWIYENKSKSMKLTIQVQSTKDDGNKSVLMKGIMTLESSDGAKTVISFLGNLSC